MARKLKIQAQQTKTIAEAFSDFLLCKKALGVSDKTLKTYSQHFSAICKYLDSSAPIGGLFKRPLEEMIEQMRSSNLKDTSINSYTRTLKSFLGWCNEEGLTETNISLFRYQEVIKETYSDEELSQIALYIKNVLQITLSLHALSYYAIMITIIMRFMWSMSTLPL